MGEPGTQTGASSRSEVSEKFFELLSVTGRNLPKSFAQPNIVRSAAAVNAIHSDFILNTPGLESSS